MATLWVDRNPSFISDSGPVALHRPDLLQPVTTPKETVSKVPSEKTPRIE